MLAQLARQVVTIERFATLLDGAKEQLDYLGLSQSVVFLLADGVDGHAPHAPYDRIISNFSFKEPPRLFVDQLSTGGRGLATIEQGRTRQMLTAFTKIGSRFEPEPLFEVLMAPPKTGVATAI